MDEDTPGEATKSSERQNCWMELDDILANKGSGDGAASDTAQKSGLIVTQVEENKISESEGALVDVDLEKHEDHFGTSIPEGYVNIFGPNETTAYDQSLPEETKWNITEKKEKKREHKKKKIIKKGFDYNEKISFAIQEVFKGKSDIMGVTFHAIIDLGAWNFDKESKVQLAFSHKDLGDWNCSLGNFNILEGNDPHYWSACATIKVPSKVLELDSLLYNYIIYRRTENHIGSTEFCHVDYKKAKYFYRSLTVPPEHIKNEGSYVVYDGIIYPHDSSKNVLGLFSYGSFLPYDEQQKIAMRIHINNLVFCLKSDELLQKYYGKTLMDVSKTILVIYEQLQEKKFVYKKVVLPKEEDFKKDFVQLIGNLPNKANTNSIRSSVPIVLIAMVILNKSCPEKELILPSNWFKMLSILQEDKSVEFCKKFLDDLLQFITEEYYEDVLICLIDTITKHVKQNDNRGLEILFSLPLINILHREVHMHGDDPDKCEQSNKIQELLKVLSEKSGFRKQLLTQEEVIKLRQMSELDSLVLQQILPFCPINSLHIVYLTLPHHLSSCNLSFLVTRNHYHLWKNEVGNLLEVIMSTMKYSSKDKPQINKGAHFREAYGLLLNIIAKLAIETRDDLSSKILYSSTSLFLHASELYSRNLINGLDDDTFAKKFENIKNLLLYNWMDKFNSRLGNEFLCDKEEMEEFIHLSEIECPDIIHHKWIIDVLCKMLEQRVSQMMDQYSKIGLLKVLSRNFEPNLILVIYNAIVEGFEKKDVTNDMLWSLYEEREEHGIFVRDVINRIMFKEFSNKIFQKDNNSWILTLNDTLCWKYWNFYMTIYQKEYMDGNESIGTKCLNFFSEEVCFLAYSLLQNIVSKCSSRCLTTKELEQMNMSNENYIFELYAVINSDSKQKKTLQDSSQSFKESLKTLNKDAQDFQITKDQLKKLCNMLTEHHLDIEGLEYVINEVNSDTSMSPISSLISKDEQEYRTAIYFVHGKKLFTILKTFQIFFKESISVITKDIWKSMIEQMKKNPSLSIMNLETRLWIPVMDRCIAVLKSIELKTITLREVIRIYELCAVREDNVLYEQILKLYHAVIKFNELKSPRNIKFDVVNEPKWINESVEHMLRFLEQQRFCESAKAMVKVKQKLKLNASFEAFEKVAETVNDNILNEQLQYMVQTMEVVPFLRKVTISEESQCKTVTIAKCLEKFCNCFDIMDWIKSENKDIIDLQSFVNVALHIVTGDGDVSCDKLSDLKGVASAYEPLIFGIHADSTLEEFKCKCEETWINIKDHPTLLSSLMNGTPID